MITTPTPTPPTASISVGSRGCTGGTGSFTITNIDYNDTVCVRTEMYLEVPYEDYAQTTIGFHSPAGSVQAGSVNTIVACAPTSWTCCLGE